MKLVFFVKYKEYNQTNQWYYQAKTQENQQWAYEFKELLIWYIVVELDKGAQTGVSRAYMVFEAIDDEQMYQNSYLFIKCN